MSLYTDTIVPALLGQDLTRNRPAYVCKLAIQPSVVHEFDKGSGDTVELNRQALIGNVGLTKSARRVLESQRIGVPSNTPSTKTLTRLVLEEYMGPVNSELVAAPMTISLKTMLYARRRMFEAGVMAFHQSIGSETLSDDYQRFVDAGLYLSELANTTVTRNPGGIADGSTLVTSRITSQDTLRITETLSTFNVNRFSDGYFHCLCDNRFLTHLQEDTAVQGDYRAILTGMAYNGDQNRAIQIAGAHAAISTPSGIPLFLPPQPFLYNGVAYWATNLMPTKTINSLTARLAYYFGPGSVLAGTAGPAGEVTVRVHEQDDYGRLFSFIWHTFAATKNPIPPAGSPEAGCVLEARTFAV